jgi:hypothetical protein
MPVKKFRSMEEMNAADEEQMRWDNPRLIDRIEGHWKRWRGMIPPLDKPRGVQKFQSIEEKNAFDDHYVTERINRLRKEREKK